MSQKIRFIIFIHLEVLVNQKVLFIQLADIQPTQQPFTNIRSALKIGTCTDVWLLLDGLLVIQLPTMGLIQNRRQKSVRIAFSVNKTVDFKIEPEYRHSVNIKPEICKGPSKIYFD